MACVVASHSQDYFIHGTSSHIKNPQGFESSMCLRIRKGNTETSLWDAWPLFALHMKMRRTDHPKSGLLIWEDRKFPKLQSQPQKCTVVRVI